MREFTVPPVLILLRFIKAVQALILTALLCMILVSWVDTHAAEIFSLAVKPYISVYADTDWAKSILSKHPNYPNAAAILSLSAISSQIILGLALPIALVMLIKKKICIVSMDYESLQDAVTGLFYSEFLIAPLVWGLTYRSAADGEHNRNAGKKLDRQQMDGSAFFVSEIFVFMAEEPKGRTDLAIKAGVIGYMAFFGIQNGLFAFNSISFYLEFSLLILVFHLILFQVFMYIFSAAHQLIINRM